MKYEFRKGLMAAVLPTALMMGACATPQQEPAASGPPTASAPNTAPQPRTAREGVYTVAQAERGAAIYRTSCSACHNAQEFTGASFAGTWGARPVSDIHEFISDMMPMDAPGSLTAQEYTDIVAYLIRQNGFPAGSTELPTSRDALRLITFGSAP